MLKQGQRVRVFIPSGEKTVSKAVRKHHDKVATIKEAIHHRATNNGTSFTYTLENCYSIYGIYFEFMEDWLIPYDVEEEIL